MRRRERATKWRDIPRMHPWRFRWWTWRIEVKRQDAWIGAYWSRNYAAMETDIWICLVPMLPLHIRISEPPF